MNPSPADLAVKIREALPEDGPALIAAIETIDTETDFLGEPGDGIPWADHAEQQLRTVREKESAVYFLALEADAVIGYLGAYRGGFTGNRGTLFIAHVGIRTHRRGSRRWRTGRVPAACIGSSCASTRRTSAASGSIAGAASPKRAGWSRAIAAATACATIAGWASY